MKEKLKTAISILLVIGCLAIFWTMLIVGICDEAERKEGQKSNRRWVQERAINQWETEQQAELMKAMHRAVAKGEIK